jgi:8-oxo-dGTP pyrophosphatase MutT (NUDIX family)
MRTIWERFRTLGEISHPPDARAAVLVALYEDPGGAARLVLTKRPDTMRTHPGDIVFPGGRMEDGEDPVRTALREACEEIGLGAASVVEIFGGLSHATTGEWSRPIVPVVARIERPAELVADPTEVDAIIEPRLEDLLDDTAWRTSDWYGRTLWFYEFDEGTLWGATALMVRELLEVIRRPQEPSRR